MPPAAAAIIPAVAGTAGAVSGGKKGNKQAQQTADRQFQFQQQLFNKGLEAWQPAANYYQSLLSGDPTKIAEAVGPTSDILKQQTGANARQIAATMPAGGEARAAQAANLQDSYNSIARLYAGVQPGAATALGQLAGMPMSASAPNVGSGLKYDTHQQEQLSNAKGSLGTGIGTVIQQGRQAKQGKRQPTGGAGSGSSKGI